MHCFYYVCILCSYLHLQHQHVVCKTYKNTYILHFRWLFAWVNYKTLWFWCISLCRVKMQSFLLTNCGLHCIFLTEFFYCDLCENCIALCVQLNFEFKIFNANLFNFTTKSNTQVLGFVGTLHLFQSVSRCFIINAYVAS